MSTLSQPVPKPVAIAGIDRPVGAVVIGGDYQGLGIVRSLGRQGIPVCVVDDELSIGRYSRYSTKFVKLVDLRDERVVIDDLSELGKRLGLEGVGSLPNPGGTCGRDIAPPFGTQQIIPSTHTRLGKREVGLGQENTYRLAQELDIQSL